MYSKIEYTQKQILNLTQCIICVVQVANALRVFVMKWILNRHFGFGFSDPYLAWIANKMSNSSYRLIIGLHLYR